MNKIVLVKKDYINSRIDKWIKLNISNIPQSLIEKSLRNKKVTVNKLRVKSSYKLKINDEIYLNNFNPKNIFYSKKKKYTASKKDIKDSKTFVLEDNNNFCVLNKPSGLPVQGGSKVKKNLVDMLIRNPSFSDSKPYIVHRIDKETSGILIVAKNREYAQLFTSLFRIRKIHKTYLCLCHGEVNDQKGQFDSYLIRYDKNKKISERGITNFKVLEKNTNYTLLILNPITGRKHQLRKHLFSNGNPVVGDSKYNYFQNKDNLNKNLMLHAYSIKFIINNQKFEYSVNAPDYFKKFCYKKKIYLSKNF